MKIVAPILFALLLFSCSDEKKKEFNFSETKKKLIPLHEKMGAPEPGSWLSFHAETNITLKQYQKLKPIRKDSVRNKIYILPFGDFDSTESKLVLGTAEYLNVFFGLEVVVLDNFSDSIVPFENTRTSYMPVFTNETLGTTSNRYWVDTLTVQLQTKFILYEVLKPSLPNDAVVMIALCDKDLYPDETYNFVFGQASLKDRVGVWSFARFGDPHDKEQFTSVLLRTLKTASHETGHMFSIKHCSRYHCIMNGSNHLVETDQKPTWLCPDCLEKFCWNFNIEAKPYFEKLRSFWKKLGIKQVVEGYDNFITTFK